MNRKIIGLVAVAAFIAVPLAIKFSGNQHRVEIEVAKVEKKQILPSILASGNLVYRQEVQLSSEVIGKVVEVLVKEGDKIEKGQVLLRLNPSTYLAAVAQQDAQRRNAEVSIERAQFNLENQRRKLERSKRLAAEKFIDASKYEDEVHQMELAQVELRASGESRQQALAMLSQAKEALAKTEVRAPISGTATSVQIKIGETAVASTTGIAGSNMMTIADVSSLMAEVNVDEADIARVVPGQRAKVFPAAFADKAVDGVVESVSMTPKAGAQSKSYVVKIRLDAASAALRTGMTCRVEISTGGGDARPVLPIPAIMASEADAAKGVKAGNYVFAVVDGVARKKAVEVGLADDNNQEIVKGLALGDTVATGPARILRSLVEGAAVKVIAAKPAGGAAP